MTQRSIPRIPIISTLIVLAAVITMIALGFWQLGRMDEKEALIARYADSGELSEVSCQPRLNMRHRCSAVVRSHALKLPVSTASRVPRGAARKGGRRSRVAR